MIASAVLGLCFRSWQRLESHASFSASFELIISPANCSTDGLGFGVFNLKDGIVVGADYNEGRYRGTATENAASGEIALDLSFEVPAECGGGTPTEFDTGPGVVTAMIKRIPDGSNRRPFMGSRS
jgi:hypothetical protein